MSWINQNWKALTVVGGILGVSAYASKYFDVETVDDFGAENKTSSIDDMEHYMNIRWNKYTSKDKRDMWLMDLNYGHTNKNTKRHFKKGYEYGWNLAREKTANGEPLYMVARPKELINTSIRKNGIFYDSGAWEGFADSWQTYEGKEPLYREAEVERFGAEDDGFMCVICGEHFFGDECPYMGEHTQKEIDSALNNIGSLYYAEGAKTFEARHKNDGTIAFTEKEWFGEVGGGRGLWGAIPLGKIENERYYFINGLIVMISPEVRRLKNEYNVKVIMDLLNSYNADFYNSFSTPIQKQRARQLISKVFKEYDRHTKFRRGAETFESETDYDDYINRIFTFIDEKVGTEYFPSDEDEEEVERFKKGFYDEFDEVGKAIEDANDWSWNEILGAETFETDVWNEPALRKLHRDILEYVETEMPPSFETLPFNKSLSRKLYEILNRIESKLNKSYSAEGEDEKAERIMKLLRIVRRKATGSNARYAKNYAREAENAYYQYGMKGLKVQVAYVLSNLGGWRGDEAKEVKAELRKLTK